MKKKLLCLLGVSLLAIGLGACGNKGGEGGEGGNTPVQPTTTKYTVAFEVDGERVLSLDPFDDQPVVDFDVIQVIDPYQSFGAYEELKYLKMVKIWSNEGLRLKSLSD